MSVEDGPKGIDVSKWQVTTPNLAGLDFLFARATIGTKTDEQYDDHVRQARREGLLVGAYHFNWSTLSVSSQVKAFLAKAGDVDFYALDVEYAGDGISQFSRAEAREFIRLVRAAGKKCGLYMSQSGYYTDVDTDFRWVARWGTQPPAIKWDFWQYQGSPLDKNRFNGDVVALKALANQGDTDVIPLPISSEEPRLVSKTTQTNFYDLDGKTVVRTADSLGPDRYSMYGAGPVITVNGKPESEFRAVNSAGRVLLVRPVTYKPIPQPECPPSDCFECEDSLARTQAALESSKAKVTEQATTIADLKTDLAEVTLSLTKTHANIDALKA